MTALLALVVINLPNVFTPETFCIFKERTFFLFPVSTLVLPLSLWKLKWITHCCSGALGLVSTSCGLQTIFHMCLTEVFKPLPSQINRSHSLLDVTVFLCILFLYWNIYSSQVNWNKSAFVIGKFNVFRSLKRLFEEGIKESSVIKKVHYFMFHYLFCYVFLSSTLSESKLFLI